MNYIPISEIIYNNYSINNFFESYDFLDLKPKSAKDINCNFWEKLDNNQLINNIGKLEEY